MLLTGLEPVRCIHREILSLLRLPISPQQHNTIISQKATLVKSGCSGVIMKQFSGFQKGVNLGGWLSQCPHTKAHYDSFISSDDIRVIAGWGADHVRLPIDYEVFEAPDGTWLDCGFARVAEALQWCKDCGLNLVIDLHKTAGYSFDSGEAESGLFDSEALQERFYRLWEEIARRFGGETDCVVFELLNEVTDKAFLGCQTHLFQRSKHKRRPLV